MNKEICPAKSEKNETETSLKMRELLAAKYVLTRFDCILKNQSFQVNMDNSRACRILSIDSSKLNFQNLATDASNFCTWLSFKLILQ